MFVPEATMEAVEEEAVSLHAISGRQDRGRRAATQPRGEEEDEDEDEEEKTDVSLHTLDTETI